MKFHNPMILRSIDLPRGITFTLNPIMGTQEDPGIENLETDLLVLTQMTSSKMSEGMQKIDRKLSGALSAAMKERAFGGDRGDFIVVDCRSISGAKQKYVLVAGLGSHKSFNSFVICGLMRLVLEEAQKLGVQKLTIPFMPNRQTEAQVSLAASVNTLVCKVRMFQDDLPKLQEVELFCTPQARQYLQDGLMGHTPRCMLCRNPELSKL
jgi:hypothetical protein